MRRNKKHGKIIATRQNDATVAGFYRKIELHLTESSQDPKNSFIERFIPLLPILD